MGLQQRRTALFKAPLTPLQTRMCSEGFSCTSITKHTSRDRAFNGLWFHLSVQCTWCSNLNSSQPCFMEKVLQKHQVSTYQLGMLKALTPLPRHLTHTYFVCSKKFWHFWWTQLCRWLMGFLLIGHRLGWKSSKETEALFPLWKAEAFESQTHQCALM